MSCPLPTRPPSTHAAQLNDVHSRLNRATAQVARPDTVEAAQRLVRDCAHRRQSLAVMGARHAMGGQQFLDGGRVLDTARLDRIIAFDASRGLVKVEAGIRWPALMASLARHPDNVRRWSIRQKQTGADDFSLGGALASNIHGRGLALAPFVEDVEAIELIDARGELVVADRHRRPDLFALVAGGYGLFGLAVAITLRLVPRVKLVRDVRMSTAARLMADFDTAIAAGSTYGDFQFSIDPRSEDFLDLGILSCYRPVASQGVAPARHLHAQRFAQRDFARLLLLAHIDPGRAFREYAEVYLASSGQQYASDEQQAGIDLGDYHAAVDQRLGHCGSEMITELYVPRARYADFMAAAAQTLRRAQAQPIYGTVRLVEADTTSMLAWARAPWACIVFNLHVRHDRAGLDSARAAFRALIDLALDRGGSFYLTYHRWARRAQIEAAYPRFREFLRQKQALDPGGLWASDWYRHQQALFA